MFVFVSDLFVEDYVGGAELTTDAILQEIDIPVLTIKSADLNKKIIDTLKDRYWIFGNFASLSTELILYCCKNLQYSVIEYDYKYCKYRLPQKHIAAEGACECEFSPRGKLTSIFLAKANSLWFMSLAQKQFYIDKFPFLDKTTTRVLSSVFDKKTLEYISSLEVTKKNETWLIQDSSSWVKGTESSVSYAEKNNLPYESFRDLKYEQMLQKFAKYKGFLFLPRSFDTCPRTVIEAKLLDCQLILNENVQHKDEPWFTGSKEEVLQYLTNRASFFWEKVIEDIDALPNFKQQSKEETHFKIIIPVYNSEGWINKCLESVKNQNYSNFECIVCDDMSTDGTWQNIEKLNLDNRFIRVKNVEKKYALKNINDGIEILKPSKQDVILVLDGDDWLSTPGVLSEINNIYNEKECWMTYGSFIRFPDGVVGEEATAYPESVVKDNSFRTDLWRASHLKTFKYFLWNNIDKKDLKDENGKFYEVSYDQAMMLPMLEMSGHKSSYVEKITYVYNVDNPNAVNKSKAKKQYDTMLQIRKKNTYSRLKKEE
tara:strand:- start:7492 stop:9117 length:1626 start_codon:yes stop_codon:yes gene_type:complete